MLPQENGAKYFVELRTRDILALMELMGMYCSQPPWTDVR